MVNTTLCKSWQRPSICPPQPPHPPEERLQNSRAVHSNVENTTIILSEDKHQSRIMAPAATALKRFQKLQNIENMKMMKALDPQDTWPIFMFIPASKCPSFRDAHISCSFHSHSSFSSIYMKIIMIIHQSTGQQGDLWVMVEIYNSVVTIQNPQMSFHLGKEAQKT